ncbi:MAG: signal peptidase I [Treponema sp.]|nr:signal peptidase I [Treponema sp.]
MNGKKAVFCALLTAVLLNIFVFDFIVAHGNSMEPVIQNGNVLIVSRLRYGIRVPLRQRYLIMWAQPRVGEVVVFYTPTGELAVKRVTQLTEQGTFWALGDNSLESFDSRFYGFVPVNNIVGKVLGR